MLLLPGSLPADRATLKALCVRLNAPANIVAWLNTASVEQFSGSWSDAEREALGLTGDLCDGQALAPTTPPVTKKYAVATPLHAALGLTDLTPLDPTLIALSDHESLALCQSSDQHLSADGVRLSFIDANTWLVILDNDISVLTERPDWLIGEPLRPSLPRGKDARLVERWMNELQMLLFAHPVNAAREERGLPQINVVWLWGFGARPTTGEPAGLPPLPLAGEGWGEGGSSISKVAGSSHLLALTPSPSAARGRGVYVPLDFVTALRNGNVPTWQGAWQLLSSEILSADSIILGDSRPRLRLTPRKPSIASKVTALFQRKPTLEAALNQLQQQL